LKRQKNKLLKEEEDKYTEEDVKVPLGTLVINKRSAVKIRDMADYSDIFYAIESTVLQVWFEDLRLNDKDVLYAYASLLKDFDHQPDGSLASEIAKSVKAFLLFRKQDKQKDYTYGEITSCLFLLSTIAKDHHSADGVGYLKWIRTFYDGNMPTDVDDILNYILQNEL
jgi:hypothetical protein